MQISQIREHNQHIERHRKKKTKEDMYKLSLELLCLELLTVIWPLL